MRRHGSPDAPRALLLLHGGPGAPGTLSFLAATLAEDARFPWRIVEPWQRRSGGVPLTVARHVADLAPLVEEGSVLLGHSWGAMLALSYAMAHPSRASALILVGCGTYDVASRMEYQENMQRRLSAGEERDLARWRRELREATDDDTRDRVFAHLGDLYDRCQSYDPRPAPSIRRADFRGHEETWNDVLRRQEESIEPAGFRAIDCPAVMIHGAGDPHPGRRTRDLLRGSIEHLDYHELPRCGHSPWRERHASEPFFSLLASLLDEVSS